MSNSKQKAVASVTGIKANEDVLAHCERVLAGIPGGAKRAMLNAFNRAMQEGRTAGTKEVRKKYVVSYKDVKSSFSQHKRASNEDLSVELWSRGKRLPITAFKYSPQEDTTGSNRKQIRVQVTKSGGLKSLGQAFVWNKKVYQRIGETRLPVQQVYSSSVPSLINNPEVVEAVETTIAEAVPKRLDHEIYRLLNGFDTEPVWNWKR